MRDRRDTIRDFAAYVTAYHGCNEYFRRRFRNASGSKTSSVICWEKIPGSPFGPIPTENGIAAQSPNLRCPKSPTRMALRWGVSDQHVSMDRERHEVAEPGAPPAESLERKAWLARLWEEIRELPLRQRICVLLNLRDHQRGAAIGLLPVAGVASIREIAAVLELEMEAAQLAKLWRDLPLDDASIATRLGGDPPQVKSRKSARERPFRKLARIAPESFGRVDSMEPFRSAEHSASEVEVTLPDIRGSGDGSTERNPRSRPTKWHTYLPGRALVHIFSSSATHSAADRKTGTGPSPSRLVSQELFRPAAMSYPGH